MVRKESIDLIRNYIISREGKATKRQVVNYMQNEVPENLKLSRDPVIDIINNLENLVITTGERRGQGHKLLMDDKNEFNSIQKQLSSIENSIDVRQDGNEKEYEDNKNFEYQFIITGLILLLRTIVRINDLIKSQKDLQILYQRVIKIMQKLAKHSSRKLSWDLLETEEEDLKEDLKIMAISQEILKLWNR